jgi:hypothetical protein
MSNIGSAELLIICMVCLLFLLVLTVVAVMVLLYLRKNNNASRQDIEE